MNIKETNEHANLHGHNIYFTAPEFCIKLFLWCNPCSDLNHILKQFSFLG